MSIITPSWLWRGVWRAGSASATYSPFVSGRDCELDDLGRSRARGGIWTPALRAQAAGDRKRRVASIPSRGPGATGVPNGEGRDDARAGGAGGVAACSVTRVLAPLASPAVGELEDELEGGAAAAPPVWRRVGARERSSSDSALCPACCSGCSSGSSRSAAEAPPRPCEKKPGRSSGSCDAIAMPLAKLKCARRGSCLRPCERLRPSPTG